MNTLSSKLRATIRDHVDVATPSEIRKITELLCTDADRPQLVRQDEPRQPGPIRQFDRLAEDGDVVIDGGSMVRDNTTGLIWTRCNVGVERLDWEKAKAACAALELGGHRDWRLPTIRELLSIVDYGRKEPAIDPVFACESNWYWSSTPYTPLSGCAWLVYFDDGYSSGGHHDHDGFVRAVRGGQF